MFSIHDSDVMRKSCLGSTPCCPPSPHTPPPTPLVAHISFANSVLVRSLYSWLLWVSITRYTSCTCSLMLHARSALFRSPPFHILCPRRLETSSRRNGRPPRSNSTRYDCASLKCYTYISAAVWEVLDDSKLPVRFLKAKACP